MKLRVNLAGFSQILLSCLSIYASPLSSSLSQPSSPVLSIVDSDISKCEPVEIETCANIYSSAQLPNVYGHNSSKVAGETVDAILSKFSQKNSTIVNFICTLYLPPCAGGSSSATDYAGSTFRMPPLPCRPMCELAAEEGRQLLVSEGHSWPIPCQTLPTENCFNFIGPNSVAFVKQSIIATPRRTHYSDVVNFAPLEVELGNDDGYELEVVSSPSSDKRIPERRYDIANLGDPNLFQGWTDVQGTGAANDYCRVISKGKRRFLSCNLAGSTGQGHHYVSKLGFEAGHPNTWFMRDMDGDGRDDYCRCVGPNNNSKITCMKAGEFGFYGSTTQGGYQHTFTLPNSEGCFNKRFNPMFGEKIF